MRTRRQFLWILAAASVGVVLALPKSVFQAPGDAPSASAQSQVRFGYGLHFAPWERVRATRPDCPGPSANVQVWRDNRFPSPEVVAAWASLVPVDYVFFYPYAGHLYSAPDALQANVEKHDQWVIAVAELLARQSQALVPVIIPCWPGGRPCASWRFQDFDLNAFHAAFHLADLSRAHPGIAAILWDEPQNWRTDARTLLLWTRVIKQHSPALKVMVVHPAQRPPSESLAYWESMDAVMIDDYRSDAAKLRDVLRSYREALRNRQQIIGVKPFWVWLPTGDVSCSAWVQPPVYTNTSAMAALHGVAREYVDGVIVWDDYGKWLYGGERNPYDKGARLKCIAEIYTAWRAGQPTPSCAGP